MGGTLLLEIFLGLKLLLTIFLVFLNGFFVAAEFAIVKVREIRIASLIERGHSQAKVAQKVINNLDAYLSATQLGITFASLGLGWLGEPTLTQFIGPALTAIGTPAWMIQPISFIIAFSIITFLHIVLGEMAPKSLAIRKSEQTTLWTAKPLHLFYKLFYPFIVILNGTANLILRWLGVPMDPEQQQAHTEEEIRMLVAQSHQSGMIDQTELSLLDNVFEFADRVAREVMVPRVDLVCLYTDDSLEENLQTIKNARHTRFPLCHEDKDNIIGIVHIRHVYECLLENKKPNLVELASPVLRVPETIEIKDLLHILQKNRMGMAIVVDEYGGTSGLVTTEDIIEEIVGEIQDEFDDERPFFQKNGTETSIDARLLIEEVNEYFNIDIHDPDNDTIGGWVFSRLQEIPQVGDSIQYDDFHFTVEEMDQHSITRLLVKSLSREETSS